MVTEMTLLRDVKEDSERTCAELRIYSEALSPTDISAVVGILPTSSVTRGECIQIRDSDDFRIGSVNGWFLSSEHEVVDAKLSVHLDWLIGRLMGHRSRLLELQSRPGIEMWVSCVWWSKTGRGGPTLWPKQLSGLAELNLECQFDFQDYSDD